MPADHTRSGLSPAEAALADADADLALLDELITPVITAWNDGAGSHPEHHEQVKAQLYDMWPALYKAIDTLAKSAPKEP